ncbi:MAG: hypothetical protein KGO96_00385 [Elusimicrobia bacterium]|nr:hypothetical protein [Elusimicrobiota bacterium]MDE2238144.1 hypothetical protein [Elusimicrobiota bacterium]MDE2424351.1 hypothetical protein [Elusimicrobiota bacterium]
MRIFLGLLMLAIAPPAAAAAGTAFRVASSTAAPQRASDIYTAADLRDPFEPATAASGDARRYSIKTDFNIHNLSLRAIMTSAGTSYALFSDPSFGVSFILHHGKLYDQRGKLVRGVFGRLRPASKWAVLETKNHDMQTFRLGEQEKE